MPEPRLSIRALRKSFNFPVLKDVDLTVAAGEVHAIVGENGAGKSTLVNILSGLVPRDAGDILIDGETYDPTSAVDGFAAGISFTAQELSIAGDLSIAENIAIRDLPTRWLAIDTARLDVIARDLLGRVGLDGIDPASPAESLTLADRQLLELAKAISADCRLLVLDEPTASLNAPQAELVHGIVAELASKGTGVIYISHRLADVLVVAHRITVLRDGEVISSLPAGETSIDRMMEEMTGGSSAAISADRDPADTGPVTLETRNVTTADLPNAVNITCRRGEIVGVGGLAGAGKTELLQALFGLAPPESGSVIRHEEGNAIAIGNAGQAVRAGIGFLAENRQSSGIFPGMSVLENVMTPVSARSPLSTIDRQVEAAAGESLRDRLSIRCAGLEQPIEQLSGGNQQKALIARWLNRDADVLLFDEPTRGVDVGTKEAIYQLLLELRNRGKSIVVSSSENEELMTICDRILVMSHRKIVAEFQRGHWSETGILAAAFQEFTGRTAAGDESGAAP